MQRSAYLGVGVLAGVLLAGHGSISGHVLAGSLAAPCGKPSQPALTTTAARLGQTITVKLSKHLWRLTLTGISIHTSVHGTLGSATAKGKFVLVFLTVTNLDNKPQAVGLDGNFSLVDSQGRSFSTTDNSDAVVAAGDQTKRDFYLDPVQPSFSAHVVLVFDVAKDAHGFKLENSDILGENAQTLFVLGV